MYGESSSSHLDFIRQTLHTHCHMHGGFTDHYIILGNYFGRRFHHSTQEPALDDDQ